MANQKEMREIRERLVNGVQNMEFEGFEFVGLVVDGVLLQDVKSGAFAVVKPIVKKEGFDADEALQEFVDKESARLEREAERAKKAAEREAKKEKAE